MASILLGKYTTGKGLAVLAQARHGGPRWWGVTIGDLFIGLVVWPRHRNDKEG